MKTDKTKKVVDSLAAATGIQMEAYRRPELAETLANLLILPRYALSSLLRPIGIFLGLTFCATLAMVLTGYGGVSASFLFAWGLILSLPNGLVWGVVWLLTRFRRDLTGISATTIDLTRQLLGDIRTLREKTKAGTPMPRVRDLFQAMMFHVVIPEVGTVIRRKVPVFGRFLAWVICGTAARAGNMLISGDLEAGSEVPDIQDEAALIRYCDQGVELLEKTNAGLSLAVSTITGIAAFPFKVAGCILTAVTILVPALILLM